jgi:membrane protease YdiL (CAAX protease family)
VRELYSNVLEHRAAERKVMRESVKRRGKELGLALLNFAVVFGLLFGTQALILKRVGDTQGLLIVSVVVLAAYWAGTRWIEGHQPPELAGRSGVGEFAAGLGLGIVLFASVMGLLWMVGDYHPAGHGALAGLATGFLIALTVGIGEEIMVRGFIFRIVEIAGGTWMGVLLSSALFGAGHAFNPGATVLSSIAIALEAGVLLAAAYVVTGRLWFPIGLHTGWNFTEGSLFGMSVSGHDTTPGLLAGTLKGPVILTGGAFGPEASIFAVAVCLAAAALLLRRSIQLHRVKDPMWSRPKM